MGCLAVDKLIKIEIKQDRAVYRLPYSMEVIETYPLPPYSTVLGFIHSILGLREAIWGINVSVQGEYGGLFRDYAHFH
ncbi:MAG: CRISPR-associated protein Cas5t, partial [Candidatus Atribacteria bacterium]|nr:CRISPR-associated protein Cas5t [Candidatus Atribacteria bacterium]